MTALDLNQPAQDLLIGALADAVRRSFLDRYGRAPTWLVAAPGRVNLIGEHIDYNDGFVLPMAIDRYVVIAAAPSAANQPASGSASRVGFQSLNLNEAFEADLSAPLSRTDKEWSNYILGVLAGWIDRGQAIPGFDAVLQSSVPLGGGLSSSAALEVATATLIEAILGQAIDCREKALLCQQAEHRFAGVPCGIMDQFSSVFGEEDSCMLLDCASQEIRQVPFAADDVSVLITNSNVKHALTGGEYAQRRAECDSALRKIAAKSWRDVTLDLVAAAPIKLTASEVSRARHVVTEIARTLAAADALQHQDWASVGTLMFASHDSLRDDYQVSCPELDALVDAAAELGPAGGVIGSRMTGGGFGGCTVTLVRTVEADRVTRHIQDRYHRRTGIHASSFITRPARGAHVILRPN